MDNTCFFNHINHTSSIPSSSAALPAAFLKSQLKRWFPHSPQHGQPATISFGSASAEIYSYPAGVVGLCEGVVYLTSMGRPADIGLLLGKACYPRSR